MTDTERLTKVEERAKSNTRRIDNLDKKVDDLQVISKNLAVLTQTVIHLSDDMTELKDTVNSVKNKPADSAEKFKWIVITALASTTIGAALTFVLSKIIGG